MVTPGDIKANIVVTLGSSHYIVFVNGWLFALKKETFLAEH